MFSFIRVKKHSVLPVLKLHAYWPDINIMLSRSKKDQPVARASNGPWQKSLPGDTTVEIVNDSDSDAYEHVDISEGDDKICPLINTLTTKFQDVYRLEEALTTDQAICPFRGATTFMYI
jgi:hypothetical protein